MDPPSTVHSSSQAVEQSSAGLSPRNVPFALSRVRHERSGAALASRFSPQPLTNEVTEADFRISRRVEYVVSAGRLAGG